MKALHNTIVCLLLTLVAMDASAQEISELYSRIGGAVVTVASLQTTGESNGRFTGVRKLGSGVLVDRGGKVMTAAHLVQTADRVQVEFVSGEVVNARVIASSMLADVALLQLDRTPDWIQPAELGDSDAVNVGDQILVVGAPHGVSHTLTVGYISGRHQSETIAGVFGPIEFFQTDAAINQGNSGGPMFDLQGRVIGIVSRMISESGGSEGMGFAVTSLTAMEVLMKEPTIWLGFEGRILTNEFADIFNLPQSVGVIVQQVANDSPAARLGLRPGTIEATIGGNAIRVGGDIILGVAGIRLGSSPETYNRIRDRLERIEEGENLTVEVLRAGQVLELSTAGTAPE
ncbi:MAG TPA: trypsin-like peptidase domain-containing protein [Thiohalobacter sp.]|nr:trypsin-like peptidase domain-containing protein [Thiohalobacter sp.]